MKRPIKPNSEKRAAADVHYCNPAGVKVRRRFLHVGAAALISRVVLLLHAGEDLTAEQPPRLCILLLLLDALSTGALINYRCQLIKREENN